MVITSIEVVTILLRGGKYISDDRLPVTLILGLLVDYRRSRIFVHFAHFIQGQRREPLASFYTVIMLPILPYTSVCACFQEWDNPSAHL